MVLTEAEQRIVRQALSHYVDRMDGVAPKRDVAKARKIMDRITKTG